ncbi:hypothetical protein HC031_17795 [Planosporangium thailandense]|uniref:Uncharacterized protein n=1 Tax=Planosporangium thailandense TaxID=765197 RepID=A0ABX0Y294_9ACTN|nr:hypothetical protein [Planosporangium thailandense]NJC71558.1 hypothetical protein [Planosporangium thailandense]
MTHPRSLTPADDATGPEADVASASGRPEPATDEPVAEGAPRGGRAAAVLAVLGVAWLAATLWSAHATLTRSGGLQALNEAALALPAIFTASLVAGVAVGFAAAQLSGPRVPRAVAGLGGGLVIGLAVAALILLGYGSTSALVVLAAAMAATSLIGGAASIVRPPAIVGATVAGSLAWVVLSLLEAGLYNRLLKLLGAGTSVASQVTATHRLALAAAVCGGIVAGVVAYRYLRRRPDGLGWPAYLAAGAGPGVLLLVADLVTLIAGGRLRSLAAASSEADRAALTWASNVGLNTALVVLFVGAITSTIAFGRTLGPSAPEAEPAAATPQSGSQAPEAGPDQTS